VSKHILATTLLLVPLLSASVFLSAATQSAEQQAQSQRGRILFKRSFKVAEGFGYRLGNPEVVLFDRHLGPDAKSCLECHSIGGEAGGGENNKNVFVGLDPALERRLARGNERNSTAVWGIGAVQALAQEMSGDLKTIRQSVLEQAKRTHQTAKVALVSKGVSFGSLTATPQGELDTSQIIGVDPGLEIRPFHAKGTRGTIRRFTFEAMWRHAGLEAPEMLKRRYPLQGNWERYDHDGDGVVNEITTEQITDLSVFQALLPIPQEVQPKDSEEQQKVQRGEKLFQANCASCHISRLPLNKAEVTIEGAMGQKDTKVDLEEILPKQNDQYWVALYSDMKRHDIGPGLAEKNGQISDNKVTGVDPRWFITTKLWGVADTAPYLHDGRAKTLEEAIVAHGGEAEPARQAFQAMSLDDQVHLVQFLKSLRAPDIKAEGYVRPAKY
jgi:Di-haem oxidoreductase, putative peroxidase